MMNPPKHTTPDKTKELVSFWQGLMVDHHKDRDCHFYITHDFRYHSGLELTVSHYGYVVADDFCIVVKDMDEAMSVLERQLHRQILDEINSNLEREESEEFTEKDKKFWEDKKEEFKRIYIEQCTP